MTLEEVVEAIDGRKVCRAAGQCFVNVRSDEERDHFIALGATSRDASWASVGITMYEINLMGMLDPVFEENENGEPVDVRARVLLAFFRERDGFDSPLHERLYARGAL